MLPKEKTPFQKRRGNHEGSYSYDESKQLYRYRESFISAEGKRKAKDIYSKTKSDLRRKVKQWHKERKAGLDVQTNLTVKSWIQKWLILKKPTIRPRTFYDYQKCMERYIIPAIGNIRISRLTVADCQGMLNSFTTTLSAGTINDIRRRLKVMVRAAVDQGLIAKDVAGMTKPIHQRKTDVVALSESEVQKLFDVLDHWDARIEESGAPETVSGRYNRHAVRVMIYLALNSGCRLGELLGMSWKQVSFAQRTISITQSLSQAGGRWLIEDVKTRSSFRKIDIPDSMMQMLRQWKEEQSAYAAQLANLYDRNLNLLFSNSWGKPINSSNFYQRYWKKLVRWADLRENVTFHSLRKTHATLLLRAGVNIKVVSERLGHSSTSVTANVYSALLPDMQDQAVQALDKIFKKGEEMENAKEKAVAMLQHNNGGAEKSEGTSATSYSTIKGSKL